MYRLIMKHSGGRDEYVKVYQGGWKSRDAMFYDRYDAHEVALILYHMTNIEIDVYDDDLGDL